MTDPKSELAAREPVVRAVVYDGDEYTRESLHELVSGYQDRQQAELCELERLRAVHDEISREMSRDLVEQKSAWDCLRGMVSLDAHQVGTSFRSLLERIPMVNDYVSERPLVELLREKIQVAEVRTRQVGKFLDEVDGRIADLRSDVSRLHRKLVVAAQNGEKAARVILDLRQDEVQYEEQVARLPAEQGRRRRELEAAMDEIRHQIWEHGARLRLYKNAEDRISAIVSMDNNFLQMLVNLHSNMTVLHESGQEILDELRGNLSGLATAAQASELTLDMQKSMASLKGSVNKVAVLASQTSLFLTQNVERLTSQMKIYDEATLRLVESNLAAEKEILEKRVDETLALARQEHDLALEARGVTPLRVPSSAEAGPACGGHELADTSTRLPGQRDAE